MEEWEKKNNVFIIKYFLNFENVPLCNVLKHFPVRRHLMYAKEEGGGDGGRKKQEKEEDEEEEDLEWKTGSLYWK